MPAGTSCRYYTERVLSWMLNNKLIVFLGLLSFCLFVSTLAMAGQKNRAVAEAEELKKHTTPEPGPTQQTPTDTPTNTPTEAQPTETPAPITTTVTDSTTAESTTAESTTAESTTAKTDNDTAETSEEAEIAEGETAGRVLQSDGSKLLKMLAAM